MRINYHFLTSALLGALLCVGQQAQAQEIDWSGSYTECPADQDQCLVEYANESGLPIANALINTIANDADRPADRVYVLKRAGFYYITNPIQNSGFHLRIEGQTAEEAAANDQDDAFICGDGDDDCGPALIQRINTEDGGDPPGNMFESNGDLTLRRVWLMGQTRQGAFGAYGPLKMQAQGATYTFDEVYFDRLYWMHLHGEASNINVYVTNSVMRNLITDTQRWEGRGIRFEAGADTVVFENNTFFNIGSFPFQSEAAPASYLRFNHNTLINIGRQFNAGDILQEAYVTNNIFVNGFWHGEDESQYGDPQRDDPYTGFFPIGALPAEYGTEDTRRIVFNNNLFWRDDAFNDYYASVAPIIRAQPLVNDTTLGFVQLYEGMRVEDNYCMDASLAGCAEEVSLPDFGNAPTGSDMIDAMIANISDIRAEVSPSTKYFWDPGRQNPELFPVWPVPEDFSYTTAALMDAGTDGLPLGDLNWFPDAKQTFLDNQEEYVAEIEELAGARSSVVSVAFPQAESGTLVGGAEVVTVEGFVNFYFETSGPFEWNFELDEGGTYGLNVNTNMGTETERGQRIIVNGTGLRNKEGYGEYYFCTNPSLENCDPEDALPTEEWAFEEIRAADLFEGAEALTMEAGTNTIRIEPSWGYQRFAEIEIVDQGGNVVQTLSPTDATNFGAMEECADADYCPRGFASVALGAGDGVSVNFNAPSAGDYLFRVFYASGTEGQGDFAIDGTNVASVSIGADTSSVVSEAVEVSEGVHTLTFTSPTGGLNVDAIQVLQLTVEGLASEPNVLPEGYALDQNYPNPFNPSTTIRYTMGAPGDVRLDVYNVLGQKVAVLVDGRVGAGPHTVQFQARDLASGIYFYRIETPVGSQVRKMVLVK